MTILGVSSVPPLPCFLGGGREDGREAHEQTPPVLPRFEVTSEWLLIHTAAHLMDLTASLTRSSSSNNPAAALLK